MADFLKDVLGNNGNSGGQGSNNQNQQSGGGGGFMDKLNGIAGGGKDSEKNEDLLDKGKRYWNYFSDSQVFITSATIRH